MTKKITPSELEQEAQRLIDTGKMPSLQELLTAIAETRERYAPLIVSLRERKQMLTPNKPPDVIVQTLRELKQPVTRDSYAELAYWKSYRKLNSEQKADVREAVYEANIQ